MSLRACCAVAAVVAAGAAPAAAQEGAPGGVAVVAAIADDDAAQRDIAAAVLKPVRTTWQLLSPQLGPEVAKQCKPGDTACLRGKARERGASHLLVISVASLGVRDHVVAVQLFSAGGATALFEESAVQPGAVPALNEVTALAQRLVNVSGPPPYQEPPPLPAAVAPPADEIAPMTVVGYGLIGVAAVAAAGTTTAFLLLVDAREFADAQNVGFTGYIVSGSLAFVGASALLVDGL